MTNITVIGTNELATAIANVIADNGNSPVMYSDNEEQVNSIDISHINPDYFSTTRINNKVRATNDLSAALENAKYVVIAQNEDQLNKYLKNDVILVYVSNMDQILENNEHIRGQFRLTFNESPSDLFSRKPTSFSITGDNEQEIEEISSIFANEYFTLNPVK